MTQMILTEVHNFDQFPDGRLRAGPFTCSRSDIQGLLRRHGLKLGLNKSAGVCSKTVMGIMISSAGPDVHGYLIGEDDLEASSSDLEAFLEVVVKPGVSFSIEGHHCPDADTMVRSSLSAWRMNGQLMVSAQRVLETRDGTRKILLNQPPTSVSQPTESSEFPLCLVG